MEIKEEKIATYTSKKYKLNLLKITKDGEIKFQVRENRKRTYTSPWENKARQKFYNYVKMQLFQLDLWK